MKSFTKTLTHCFLSVLLILLTVVSTTAPSFAGIVEDEEYVGIRGVSLEILERYPPSEYVYVGVGRSPTALIAFFQNIAPTSAVNVPLSSANSIFNALQRAEKGAATGSTALEKVLKDHFDEFLKPYLSSGKKVLLIDYVKNGSFESAIKLFDRYFRTLPTPVDYDYVSTASVRDIIGHEAWLPKEKNISLSNSSTKEFRDRLFVSYYEKVAEFSGWTPDIINVEQTSAPKANPLYITLKKDLREKMKKDPSLNEHWVLHENFCKRNLLPE